MSPRTARLPDDLSTLANVDAVTQATSLCPDGFLVPRPPPSAPA